MKNLAKQQILVKAIKELEDKLMYLEDDASRCWNVSAQAELELEIAKIKELIGMYESYLQ